MQYYFHNNYNEIIWLNSEYFLTYILMNYFNYQEKLTILLLLLVLLLSSAAYCVVCCWSLPSFGCCNEVSTTTSGWTTISVEEYCDGSSEIVVNDISDGILLGYLIRLLLFVARTGKFLIFARGDGSGDGVGILSSFSFGRTCKIFLFNYTSMGNYYSQDISSDIKAQWMLLVML